MAVGDRKLPTLNQGWTPYLATDDTVVGGLKECAVNVQGVAGGTAIPTSIGSALPTGTNSIGGTKDNGPFWTVVRTYTTSADMTTAAALTAAPTSGQKIVLDDIIISTDTAMNFSLQEETSATVFAKVYMAANSTVQLTPRDGFKTAVADKKFFGDASAAGNVAITALYHSEA